MTASEEEPWQSGVLHQRTPTSSSPLSYSCVALMVPLIPAWGGQVTRDMWRTCEWAIHSQETHEKSIDTITGHSKANKAIDRLENNHISSEQFIRHHQLK